MIKNLSKNKLIIRKARICRNVFCKAFGLMFRLKKPDFGLVFVFDRLRRADLHMFFVFFPIDAVFLDQAKRVVDIKRDFRPFSYYSPQARAAYVLELPAGAARHVKAGDRIGIVKK